MSWSFQLQLESVESGKLSIAVSDIKKDVKTYKDSGWLMPVHEMEVDLGRIINSIQLDSMQREVKTSLSGNTGFVLPGGTQFFQKDPRVSAKGDLMVKLTYKNIDDGGEDSSSEDSSSEDSNSEDSNSEYND